MRRAGAPVFLQGTMNTRSGFSLIEVVFALGLFSFCIVALLGLFSEGITENRESLEDIQASNIAALLLAQRRAAPTGTNSTLPFPLPVLNIPTNNSNAPVYLTDSGAVTQLNEASWRLTYAIQTNAYGISQVALSLTAPAMLDISKARTRYDVLTYVLLP